MLSGSYEAPIITEEAGLFDTLPQLINLLEKIIEFLKKNDINEGNPIVLFIIGWVVRTLLCYTIGDDASMFITIFLAMGAYYVYKRKRKLIQEDLRSAREAQEGIEKELKSAKKEKIKLSKQSLSGARPPDAPRSHRERHPELYSTMDDVDGVIIPNRRAGRKKKLWVPRKKSSSENGVFLKQKKVQ